MYIKYKKHITIGVILFAIILIVISLFNSTYALFSSDAYGANSNMYTTGMLSITSSSKSDNISLSGVLPMSDEEGVQTTPYVFTVENIGNLDYNFDIKLLSTGDSSTTFSSQYIKLQIDNGDVVTLSSLSNSIIKGDVTLLAGEHIDISIRIWLSEETPNSEIGKSFNSNIVTDGQAVYTESNNAITLISHINYLYNNADKTTVKNNGITYNYATSVSLMNDRLGNSTTGINDGNIRYYGASVNNYVDIGDHYEESVAKGNWDDYGFTGMFTTSEECYSFMENDIIEALISDGECTDYESCELVLLSLLADIGASSVADVCDTTTIPKGTPKLYRIIGLFKDVELADGSKKDLVKVVRDKPIGNYSWDQSASTVNVGYGVNEWSQADLMKLLNPGYESETVGGSLYWNSGTGSCYGWDTATESYTSIPCDFTNEGLSTSAQNNIVAVKWNLGGWNTNAVFANDMYSYERLGNVVVPGTTCSGNSCNDTVKRTTVWPGRVALAYPSDYGYAVDLSSCSYNLGNYNNCISTNWMYASLTLNSMNSSWLLTPNSSSAIVAWYVGSDGRVLTGNTVDDDDGVSPVFYLDSELVIGAGRGTSADPYVLW